MRQLKSCGVICFRQQPELAFLLMRHLHRFDLPKGHVILPESETDCALREFEEETGISRIDLRLDTEFRYETTYYPRYARFGGETVEKTVVIFLGWLLRDVTVLPSEHPSYEWIAWHPPHQIQEKAIDPLLNAVYEYWESHPSQLKTPDDG